MRRDRCSGAPSANSANAAPERQPWSVRKSRSGASAASGRPRRRRSSMSPDRPRPSGLRLRSQPRMTTAFRSADVDRPPARAAVRPRSRGTPFRLALRSAPSFAIRGPASVACRRSFARARSRNSGAMTGPFRRADDRPAETVFRTSRRSPLSCRRRSGGSAFRGLDLSQDFCKVAPGCPDGIARTEIPDWEV